MLHYGSAVVPLLQDIYIDALVPADSLRSIKDASKIYNYDSSGLTTIIKSLINTITNTKKSYYLIQNQYFSNTHLSKVISSCIWVKKQVTHHFLLYVNRRLCLSDGGICSYNYLSW